MNDWNFSLNGEFTIIPNDTMKVSHFFLISSSHHTFHSFSARPKLISVYGQKLYMIVEHSCKPYYNQGKWQREEEPFVFFNKEMFYFKVLLIHFLFISAIAIREI